MIFSVLKCLSCSAWKEDSNASSNIWIKVQTRKMCLFFDPIPWPSSMSDQGKGTIGLRRSLLSRCHRDCHPSIGFNLSIALHIWHWVRASEKSLGGWVHPQPHIIRPPVIGTLLKFLHRIIMLALGSGIEKEVGLGISSRAWHHWKG